MSVQSATTRNDYTAGASQTVYAYTFEIKAASDITVIVGGVTKSLNTDYTVSGVGTNSGGNVTLSAAPASGTTVSLVMEMDLARDTDYQANGAFLADDVNNDFDSLWLATNQQETELGRSLRLNQTEPTSDMTLPLKDARKGSVLAFHETTGLPVAGPTIANVDSVAGITGDIATVADNDANITTVAGISGNVTSVANISANVTTVAGNTTNINAVAADASDIGTVASNISNVNTTAGISSDVTTVAGNNVNITTVAGDSSEITTVAGVASDVSTVSGIASDVTAVAGDASDIGTVASSISNVNAVGTNITNVNNVAGNASNINAVAADGTDIGTVAGIAANVTTVAGISSDVTTVAGLETKMDTVIADASDIGTVAGISANVTTVADNSSNVTTVAGLETKMDTIIADASDIGAVATNINSVTTVSGISGDVTTVASKASDVETVADNIGDVQAASQNATNAAASAQAAASSASTAGTHATNASASASQAANSATGADDSEAAAGISASAASSSASAASSSASSAASSASDANDSQAAAALSASGASVSASAAAVSAGNSETAAATWNNFYTTYLGAAASAPSTDLLGQPLQDGALYFNTTDDTMYVFNGSIWIAAESTINIVSVPTQLAADLTTNGNDIIFGDNDKATFGAGDDLQIYHNGTNSFVSEVGSGDLKLNTNGASVILQKNTGEPMVKANTDSSVDLYYDNAKKLATTPTGIDINGQATMDGLTVDGNGKFSGTTPIVRLTETDTTNLNTRLAHGGGYFFVSTENDAESANTPRISLNHSTGDISFYEDTGTTPKLFWDASAESLGIGTTSPATALEVNGDIGIGRVAGGYTFRETVGGGERASLKSNASNELLFSIGAASEAMRIDSSGNVGIGTSSPTSLVHLSGTYPKITLNDETGVDRAFSVGTNNETFTIRNETGSANALTITNANNVGIGTNSPVNALHLHQQVVTGIHPLLKLQANTSDNTGTRGVSIDFVGTADAAAVGSRIVATRVAAGAHMDLRFHVSRDSEAMRIDSSGKVGIGTSSPEKALHINSGTSNIGVRVESSDATASIEFMDSGTTGSLQSARVGGISNDFFVQTNGTERMRIDSSGNVGINTASPVATLHTVAKAGTTGFLLTGAASNNIASFYTSGGSQAMTLDASGNVGIGTSSPVAKLEVSGGIANYPIVVRSSDQYAGIAFADNTTSGDANVAIYADGNALGFEAGNTERMRIDSSGNLLVGKTSSSYTTVGAEVKPNGRLFATANADTPLLLNRLSADGTIANFRKDGTTVGSIGTVSSGDLYIADGRNAGIKLDGGNNQVLPVTSAGSPLDATLDLGTSGAAFKDLYLSGNAYVSNGTNGRIQLGGSTNLQIRGGSAFGGIRYHTNNGHAWYKDSSELMQLDANGNLLVGTTEIGTVPDGARLMNDGQVRFTSIGTVAYLNRSGTAGTIQEFRQANTSVGYISVTGSATAYNTSSDQRLKENIADADDAGSKIDAIQVRKYDWKADGSHQDYGMIAQELQAVAPEAVSGDADSEEMMGVDYSKLVPMLIKEIQSLRNRVAQLEE